MQQQWTISQLDWDVQRKVDFIQQPAQWLDHEAPKYFPEPNSYQKKAMITVQWSATDRIHYSFLNPSKTITTEKYAQPIHGCKACSQRCSTERVQFFSMTMPDSTYTTKETEQIGLWNFALSAIFTWPLTNHLPLQASQELFAEKMLTEPGGRKCFPTVHWVLKHRFLRCRNKQTYFFLEKMCWV